MALYESKHPSMPIEPVLHKPDKAQIDAMVADQKKWINTPYGRKLRPTLLERCVSELPNPSLPKITLK